MKHLIITGVPDTPDKLYDFFLGRVRDCLHVILCFSPIGAKFGQRAQQFPGLINGYVLSAPVYNNSNQFVMQDDIKHRHTRHIPKSKCESTQIGKLDTYRVGCRCTIDWFLPWPKDALIEVAEKFINKLPMACPKHVSHQPSHSLVTCPYSALHTGHHFVAICIGARMAYLTLNAYFVHITL